MSNPDLDWRKASYSISNGACVEVGSDTERVFIRDTVDRRGTVLVLDTVSWRDIVAVIQAAQYDPS